MVHAVDGTKVHSAGSDRGGWIRRKLEKQLEGVEGSIESMEREAQASENPEQGEYRLPARLQNAQQRRQAIDRGEGKPFHVSHFRYDAERDGCICPWGEVLE